MSSPRAFISFDYDNNNDQKVLFAGQAKHSKTPFNIEDWSSKSHLPQHQWEELIEAKVKKCNMVIVLVGKNMASATGVNKEIKFAKNNNVPIFGVYVAGASIVSTLPIGLEQSRVIVWEWNEIANKVEQMMKEGKNK